MTGLRAVVQERQDLYGKGDLELNTRICIYTTALGSQRVADWAVCGGVWCGRGYGARPHLHT